VMSAEMITIKCLVIWFLLGKRTHLSAGFPN
jgi:hypothetical protein